MSLRVVKPLTITDAILQATDVTEADYSAWSSGTTYALGDRVIKTSTHKIYESLQGSNTNKDPADAANSAWWVEVSPTNRWKVFDTSNSTQTAKSTSLYYNLRPGVACNSIALLNLTSCTSARIRVTDPTAGVVYDETVPLVSDPSESDWYAYFFDPVVYRTSVVRTALPSYGTADIRVDLAGGSTLAIGVLMIGSVTSIGEGVHAGARAGITDYSRKETNDFGDTVLVQRAFAKRVALTTWVRNSAIDVVFDALTALRAVPALWIGNADISPTIVFGFYKTFDLTVQYAQYSEMNIEIEGLT